MIRKQLRWQFSAAVGGIVAMAVCSGQARANVVISDFATPFNLTGTYVAWDFGTFTSAADSFRVEAGNFGGGWQEFPSPIDASGMSHLQVTFDINPDDVAKGFNVILFDSDPTPTEYRWEFHNLMEGADQTITVPIDSAIVAAAGTTPGLDLSALSLFHIQGSFQDGDPGLHMDVTFHEIRLIPEPAGLMLAAIAAIAGLVGYRRRRRQ